MIHDQNYYFYLRTSKPRQRTERTHLDVTHTRVDTHTDTHDPSHYKGDSGVLGGLEQSLLITTLKNFSFKMRYPTSLFLHRLGYSWDLGYSSRRKSLNLEIIHKEHDPHVTSWGSKGVRRGIDRGIDPDPPPHTPTWSIDMESTTLITHE